MTEYKGTYTNMADVFRACLGKTNGVTANTYKQKLRAPIGVIEPVEHLCSRCNCHECICGDVAFEDYMAAIESEQA